MENSNNDRWSLLATDLGIEIKNDSKNNDKAENNTDITVNNNNSRNELMVLPESDNAKSSETESTQNSISETQTTSTPTTSTLSSPPTASTLTTSTPTASSTISTPNVTESGNQQFLDQKKTFTSSTTSKPSGNLSNNFSKPSTPKPASRVPAHKSTFGAGILEPETNSPEINVTINTNVTTATTSNVSELSPTNSISAENTVSNNSTEITDINVTKNQTHNQTYDSLKSQSIETNANNSEPVKPESVKRSFFGRLQQINIFGARTKNDNAIKSTDDNNNSNNNNNNNNNVERNEYKNDKPQNTSGNSQSEREHTPHGRYLPPHAQALYKAHTQSTPTVQQDQSSNPPNANKDVFDPLRQIASQISKLGGKPVANDTANNNESQNARQQTKFQGNHPKVPRYKTSHQDYRYNNTTNQRQTADRSNPPAEKNAEYYSTQRINPESLFADVLPTETEETEAFKRLFGEGTSVENEEERRLASLLGEPREEPKNEPPTEPQNKQQFDDEPTIPTYHGRVSRYPNNRHYGNNKLDNNTRTGNRDSGNNTDKKWTNSTNNSTGKNNEPTRGRRGSRFVSNGNDTRSGNGINSAGTNRPNTTMPPQSYQSRQSTTEEQFTRGRRQNDNKNIPDLQNDNIRYNNSQYSTIHQSQQHYSDYSSSVSHEFGADDADYIDEYGGDGVVSDAERLSFAQAHKNIPSWNDAVESIVDANIQRHSRFSQNSKRR
jgi:hypothetical protein